MKSFWIKFFFLAAIFLGGANSAWAIKLADYRSNVAQAFDLLETVRDSESDRAASLKATVAEVRNLLPARQTVDIGAGSVEVDNNWLEAKLKELSAPAAQDKQEQILDDIIERLGAIDSRLAEFERAQTVDANKNDDKQKINEILKRPEFQKPEKSLWQKWWDEFWKEPEPRERPQREVEPSRPATDYSGLASILRFVVIALAIAVVGFIIWRFVLPLFRKNVSSKKSKKKKEPRVILGETLAPEATADDLLTQADKLALSGDVRGAIRKGYIAALCDLSDRKIIGLARHKTNRDYLRDVRKREEILQPLTTMTGSFERHWYGSLPADETDWQRFRAEYQQTVSKN